MRQRGAPYGEASRSSNGTALSLAIRRAQGTVLVTVGGALDPAAMVRLEGVLTDLIQGQGNLAVDVDLTQVVAGRQAVATFATTQRERFRGTNLVVQEPLPARSQYTPLR